MSEDYAGSMPPNPDFDRTFAKYMAVKDARDVLGMAWMRCQPADSLIAGIADIQDPGSYYICRTLSEQDLTDEDRSKLAAQVRLVLSEDFRKKVAVRMRPKLDRLLLHTSRLMSEGDARAIAHEQLQHRRAARRQFAVTVIHRLGVVPADEAPARSALVTYDEAEAITVLALTPGGLSGFDCCNLLPICESSRNVPFGDKSFLGAVTLAGLANYGLLDHDHACVAHPLYYIRALGRLKDRSHSNQLWRSIKAGGLQVLAMAVSVVGRLQLTDILSELEAKIDKAVEEDPELAELLG